MNGSAGVPPGVAGASLAQAGISLALARRLITDIAVHYRTLQILANMVVSPVDASFSTA
jgi:hypothetical protein